MGHSLGLPTQLTQPPQVVRLEVVEVIKRFPVLAIAHARIDHNPVNLVCYQEGLHDTLEMSLGVCKVRSKPRDAGYDFGRGLADDLLNRGACVCFYEIPDTKAADPPLRRLQYPFVVSHVNNFIRPAPTALLGRSGVGDIPIESIPMAPGVLGCSTHSPTILRPERAPGIPPATGVP